MQKQQNEQDIEKANDNVDINDQSKEQVKENSSFDINKMSPEEIKSFAQALINENTDMEKELNELKQKSEKLEKTAKKAAELSSMYTDISRDFENYRKRNAEIEQTSKDNAVSEIALKIIPVYDNLKIALDSIKDEKSKEGITLIMRQFNEILLSLGIAEFKSDGEDFDPVRHNALMAEETDNEELKGKVKTAFSDGYCFKDKILKQSQVIVYK